MNRDLGTLAAIVGGTLNGANAPFSAVTMDSRQVTAGALFVALPGEKRDGHEFVAAAAAPGAAGALVARHVADCALPQVVVSDVLAALTTFAHAWRREFRGRVVGITGSNGKTTVKEMIASILAQCGPTLATQGNLNNHIGVPLTLCRLEAAQRYAVIEMGANHPGEIAHLARIAEPDVGLVINAGPAHLEGFGSLDGVAHAKGEMFLSLGTRDVAVVNADDRYATLWHGMARGADRIVTFGACEPADFSAGPTASRLDDTGFVTDFELRTPDGARAISLALAGEHNVMNALAAAAAAHAAGASLDAIAAGLCAMRAVAGRLAIHVAPSGARVIDDSYNANPGSVRAGLNALAAIPGERWLVLGEMRELGPESAQLHAEIGDCAREAGVTRLLAVGPEARHAVESFGPGASWFANADELVATVRPQLRPGVTVLVKGSRSNRLERVAGALAGVQATGGH